jgi:plastocyanin
MDWIGTIQETLMRNAFYKLPVLGMIVFAAACEAAATGQGTVHTVRMTTTQGGASGTFEPANLTVKKGDVIKYVSEGNAAHNVSFPADQNPGKSNLPGVGPYKTNGETYELQVAMDPGTYNYQCDPHAAMGMKGTLTVQ